MAQGIEASGFAEFDRLRDLFVRTRKVLNAVLVERDLPDGASEWLASESLAHVEEVEAGFRAWLRAGGSDLAELRQMILQG
ncbi:MAG: hypothetical protein ACR2JZ_03955, partial [Candidatus Limnocylindrales bacterium]